MKCLFLTVGLVLQTLIGLSQGASLSQEDLLKAYLEKRQEYRHSSTKEFTADEQAELDRLEATISENFPGSYASNLVIWINGGYDIAKKDNLFKAYELDPDSREVRNEMFAYYIITGDLAKQKEFATLIKSQYSANTLNYYRDLLPVSGLIVASNQTDSYPLYILQLIQSEAPEVLIVNLEFLQNSAYKTRIQREAAIGNTEFTGNEKSWLTTLLSASAKDVRVSATVSQAYLPMTESMYLTGLGYEYNPRDQRSSLDSFWSSVKGRDLSAIQLTSAEKRIYANYLPALLTLYKLKMLNGEEDTMLRAGISALATKVNKSETIDQILEDYETSR